MFEAFFSSLQASFDSYSSALNGYYSFWTNFGLYWYTEKSEWQGGFSNYSQEPEVKTACLDRSSSALSSKAFSLALMNDPAMIL